MLRYKLRTLLILLAILPPLLAVGWWKYSAWKAEQETSEGAGGALWRMTVAVHDDDVITPIISDLKAAPQHPKRRRRRGSRIPAAVAVELGVRRPEARRRTVGG